jgi:uncharacterized protein (TIGR02996 family)
LCGTWSERLVLDHLLQGIVEDPRDDSRWAVLADWLEEHDDPRQAKLLRLHRRLLATCCEPTRHPERAQWQASIVAMLAEGVRPCVPQRTIVLGWGHAIRSRAMRDEMIERLSSGWASWKERPAAKPG